MTNRTLAGQLATEVLGKLPGKLRRPLEGDREILVDRLLSAIEESRQHVGRPSTHRSDEDVDREFFSSEQLACEVANFFHVGELDHEEWDRIFFDVKERLRNDNRALEAPSPTAFQSVMTASYLDLRPARPSSTNNLLAKDLEAQNVVVGTQNNYIATETPDRDGGLRTSYLRRLLTNLGSISLAGIDPRVATDEHDRIAVKDIYVHLHAATWPVDYDSASRHFEGPASIFVGNHFKSVILGEPGGGKSTFANYIALCLAGELLDSEVFNHHTLFPADSFAVVADDGNRIKRLKAHWTHGALVPVKIVLRDFAVYCGDNSATPSAGSLWQYIESDLESASLGEYAPLLRSELLQKGGVLIFDGLDEVPESEAQRERIVRCIEDFSATFSLCPIVVTSRTYAYNQQGWKLGGFDEISLKDLSLVQIDTFVRLWYREVARRSDPTAVLKFDGRADELSSAIRTNPSLFDLAQRPLLLTLMSSLHAWRGGSLPEKREELYSDAVDLLLDTWESQRLQTLPNGQSVQIQPSLLEWLQCDRAAVRDLLEELAFEAHNATTDGGSETADIAESTLISRLTKLSGNPNTRPLRLVEYLSQRAGIVIQRAPGVYAFPHRTFQEYLAACYITEHDYPDSLVELFVEDPAHWREVALLAIAKASRGTSASILFTAQAACPHNTGEAASTEDLRSSILAGHALAESDQIRSSRRAARLLEEVQAFLLEAMQRDTLIALERVEAGHLLGRIGDPRPSTVSALHAEYCYVPRGLYEHVETRSNEVEVDPYDGHEIGPVDGVRVIGNRSIDLDYPFWISKYPVTNAQFLEFVESGGYSNARYWPEAQAANAWRPGEVLRSEFDESPTDEEEAEGEEWREDGSIVEDSVWRPPAISSNVRLSPNQPVSRVTWYEALAYCRWVGELGDRKYLATLPSVLEWEKAARGGLCVPRTPTIFSLLDIVNGGGSFHRMRVDMRSNPAPLRPYPWGASPIDPDRAFAEFNAIGLNTLGVRGADGLPVGLHPRSASSYGASDMVANLWQHTRSLYRTPLPRGKASATDCSEALLADRLEQRAVRGCGSWMERGSIHISHEIPARGSEVFVAGFRVVLLPIT
jgi:formylglycine-generating enzyme required for sulfatase activity